MNNEGLVHVEHLEPLQKKVRSTFLYWLETIHLTDAMLKKIDAFQLRRNTNREVLNRCIYSAGISKSRRPTRVRVIQHYSANLISVENKNYWVMYSGLATPILYAPNNSEFLMEKERVGRRRQNWLHYAKANTFELILGGDCTETVAEDSRIYNAAFTRT